MLHGFHSHIGTAEVFTVSNHAMIGHEDCIMKRNKGAERVAKLHGSSGGIWRKWNCAQSDYDFRTQGFVQGDSSGGKSGSGTGMSVHNGAHVRAHTIDREVHGNFTGRVIKATELLAVKVHNDHVFLAHHAFAEAGGRNQNAA